MSRTSFDTPILIIFWRRPTKVLALLQRLRELEPTRLFLACDGPRSEHSDEASLVDQTRQQVEQAIDWSCRIERRYSEENQGCKYGPGNAIHWFFSQVEEGIILEDDCLPHLSFFFYCESLLRHYRHDHRVWHVSGNNFVEERTTGQASYFFTGYSTTWGWATWKRCWDAYDIEMKDWPEVRASGLLVNAFEGQDELDYWTGIWNRLYHDNSPLSWDYQWNYTCFVNGGLAVIPKHNLVANIGFGEGATHCFDEEDRRARVPCSELSSIEHPKLVLRDWRLDRAIFEAIYKEPTQANYGRLQTLYLRSYFTIRALKRKLLDR